MLRFLVLLALLVGVSAPAFSQSLDGLSASELLKRLRTGVAEFKDVEAKLEENTKAASQNKARAERLRDEDNELASRSQTYDAAVAKHNGEVADYGSKCLGSKLPEDVYTNCLKVKQNLDLQKAKLDADGDKLETDNAAYNNAVKNLKEKETARAEAASQLLARYEALDKTIRDIQVKLYDLAVAKDPDGLAESVRQCTKRSTPEDVYTCMTSAFNR